MSRQRYRSSGNSFTQCVGKPGVVYILKNDGLKPGFFKIGCSTRSGEARSRDLNFDANTGTPGIFECVFQYRTQDCGTAEQRVFKVLHLHRKGKRGQEFFEIDFELAKKTILEMCVSVDAEIRARELRRAAETPSSNETTDNKSEFLAPVPPPRVQEILPNAKPNSQQPFIWVIAVVVGATIWYMASASRKPDASAFNATTSYLSAPMPRRDSAQASPVANVAPLPNVEEKKSRFGVVRTDAGLVHHALFFKGTKIYDARKSFVNLLELFSLRDLDALLFVENAGGSGSRAEYKFLVIQSDGKAKVIEDEKFASVDGTLAIQFQNEEVVVALGFETQKI